MCLLSLLLGNAVAGEHVMSPGMRCGGAGHEHHRAMLARKGYDRSTHQYALGDIPLTAMDGDATSLREVLDDEGPVAVNFVFTTCTTICPVLSGTFAQLQNELAKSGRKVRLVSISIDPEYDTPARLSEYARLFDAGPQWQFLTGNAADIVKVQKAFEVYRGNKMNHEPTILLRKSLNDPWLRLDGLASAADVARELEGLENGS